MPAMKKLIRKICLLPVFLLLLTFISPVFADVINPTVPSIITPLNQIQTASDLIPWIIIATVCICVIVIVIIAVVALILIMKKDRHAKKPSK